MSEKSGDKERPRGIQNPHQETEKKKQRLQYGWYFGAFLATFFVSYALPISLFLFYYEFVIFPVLIEGGSSGTSIVGSWPAFGTFLSLPLVVIGLYLLHIACNIFVVKGFIKWSGKYSPAREGVFERDFQESQAILKHYHFRGFLIRYIKWKLSKSLFPWLVNWGLNAIGTVQIGKNVTLEDHYLAHEFFDIGENSYVGHGTIITTHVVEGVFGRIVLAGDKVGKNCTIGPGVIVGPDCTLGDDAHVLMRGALPKGYNLRAGNYYWGRPVIRYSKRRFKRHFLDKAAVPEPSEPAAEGN